MLGHPRSLDIRDRLRSGLVTLMAAALLVPCGMASARADTSPAGSVKALTGKAEAHLNDQVRSLSLLAPVFVNDLLRTEPASRLTVLLGQTTIKLGEEAELRLARYLAEAGGVLELATGPMVFESEENAPGSEWEIKSDYGVIAVRGTRFFAGPSRGVFGVFVDRGEVIVTAAGRSVILTAGLGTNLAAPGDPPSAPKAWPEARVAEVWKSVE